MKQCEFEKYGAKCGAPVEWLVSTMMPSDGRVKVACCTVHIGETVLNLRTASTRMVLDFRLVRI